MAFTAFWTLMIFIMLDGILSVSAYPVSTPQIPRSDISVDILSGAQRQGSASTPATAILLPRDHELEEVTTTPEDQSSETDVSSEAETSQEEDGEDENGLNPNIIAGIAVGVTFGVLLIVAALMYAFRVGWEKGQRQKEKEAEITPSRPPAPPMIEPCHQTDIIKPPEDVVLETGSSCWDSGSWSCCDEHTAKFKALGERYSFRPGKGVYEIQEKDLPVDEIQEIWSTRGTSRTDSGLGLVEEGRGKENKRKEGEPGV